MKKKLAKTLCIAISTMLLALAMTACGGSAGGSKAAASSSAGIDTTYTTIRSSLIEAMGWYTNEVYTLELNTDGTYQLIYHTNRFGGEDLDMRGVRTITYAGKYTSAASSDGEPSHLDVSLEAATQITWEQHGKGFTRVQTVPGIFFINTSAWTDAMTAAYDAAGSKGAEDFLAEFAKPLTITVENTALDLEDTTLTNRIVTIPDLGILFEAEG